MTNENQENQPKLEDMLLGIAGLTDVSKGIGRSKTPQEQADLYQLAAQMISGKNEEEYKRAIREFTRDPAYAVMEIEGARDSSAENAKEQYTREKKRIAKDVESRINDTLKQAKDDKATASIILAQYLNDILLKIPEFTQEQVDELEKQQVYSMGLPYAFEARGSTEEYKNLALRIEASKYLKAIKERDNKVKEYVIDSEKLGKAMKNVVTGASLYARTVAIEKQKAEKKK